MVLNKAGLLVENQFMRAYLDSQTWASARGYVFIEKALENKSSLKYRRS